MEGINIPQLILGIVFGILESLVAAIVYDYRKNRRRPPDERLSPPLAIIWRREESIIHSRADIRRDFDWRAHNREIVKEQFGLLSFFVFGFAMLWALIFFPLGHYQKERFT